MKIIECPRDAMQGMKEFIPTKNKIRYLNELLKIGFDTLDFGSFVSPKVIPQMRDTVEVLDELDLSGSSTSLLAIVANTRGAEEASGFEKITYLGFPLSISETFQMRNTNKSIAEALDTLAEIKNVCIRKNKKVVAYISMGLGNPYGDPYDVSMVSSFIDILITLGADVISIADTVGAASPAEVSALLTPVLKEYSNMEIGIHLHSHPDLAYEKIKAAFESGCHRIDGALKGFGGCPMAKDELVGNIATEKIVDFLNTKGVNHGLNKELLIRSLQIAAEIFPNH